MDAIVSPHDIRANILPTSSLRTIFESNDLIADIAMATGEPTITATNTIQVLLEVARRTRRAILQPTPNMERNRSERLKWTLNRGSSTQAHNPMQAKSTAAR